MMISDRGLLFGPPCTVCQRRRAVIVSSCWTKWPRAQWNQ